MTIENRLNKLERSCRCHRWINFALAAVVLLIVGVGATQDHEGGNMVLDELVIQDKEGRKRIWLGLTPHPQGHLETTARNQFFYQLSVPTIWTRLRCLYRLGGSGACRLATLGRARAR